MSAHFTDVSVGQLFGYWHVFGVVYIEIITVCNFDLFGWAGPVYVYLVF